MSLRKVRFESLRAPGEREVEDQRAETRLYNTHLRPEAMMMFGVIGMCQRIRGMSVSIGGDKFSPENRGRMIGDVVDDIAVILSPTFDPLSTAVRLSYD